MRNVRQHAVFVILVAMVFVAPLALADKPNGAGISERSSGSAHQHGASLGDLLDDSGHIVLPEGFSGSIDPAGFEMVGEPGEAPRFVPASRSNGQWSEGEFGVPGCSDRVSAMASGSGELLGGTFQACALTAATNIARFDPATGEFSALGDGVDGEVRTLAAIGTDLFVGGESIQDRYQNFGLSMHVVAEHSRAGL